MVYNAQPQTQQEMFFGPNAYRLMQEDPEYARRYAAVTMSPMGRPAYQSDPYFTPDWSQFNSYDKAGDSGMQGYEAERIFNKIQAFKQLDPDAQRLAQTRGEAPTSTEIGNLFQIMNNMPLAVKQGYQQNYGDRLRAGSQAILNDPGYGGNMKDWAALNQSNKTWAAIGAADPNLGIQLLLGDQLGNIARSGEAMGVATNPLLANYGDTRDYLMNAMTPYGGWRGIGLGYQSQGMGGGPGAPSASYYGGDSKETGWGTNNYQALGGQWGGPTLDTLFGGGQNPYNSAWGDGGKGRGWMPAGSPFSNPDFGGGNGVTETGVSGRIASAPNLEGPGRGTWSGTSEPYQGVPNYRYDNMTVPGGENSNGPVIFADPTRSGSESTLDGMPASYNPDGPQTQHRGYGNGITSNESYNNDLNYDQQQALQDAYYWQEMQQRYGGAPQSYGYGATEGGYSFPPMEFENAGSGAGSFPDTGNDVFSNYGAGWTQGAPYAGGYGHSQYQPEGNLWTGFQTGMYDVMNQYANPMASYAYSNGAPAGVYDQFAVGGYFNPSDQQYGGLFY